MSANAIAVVRGRKPASTLGSVLLYGTFGLLMFGPLAFGAVEPWSMFVMEAGSAILFVLWISKQALEGELSVVWNPLFLPMGAFGLLIVAQLLLHRSAYPHDTITEGLVYCSYAILCFLSGQTLLRSSQARKLAVMLSLYGAAVAGFALLQGISPNGKLYWLRQPRNGGWIYGPYVNHNHYAGLMEMLVPIPLVLSLTHLASHRLRMAAATAAAIMVGTIFLSGSRGGMLGISAELIIVAILITKQKRGMRTAIGIGAFLAIVLTLLVWIGGDKLVERIASIGPGRTDLTTDLRIGINRDGLRMFVKRPVLGWGLGAFPVVYPEFRSFYTNFFVNAAHNDYLQLLIEMGLLGFATMIWLLIVVYRTAIRKVGNWTGDISGAVAMACLLGVSGILVHSALDFNLQIPANAALFYVLCTIAVSRPFAQPARKRKVVQSRPADEIPPEAALQKPATNF
ncbi:MAG TPA: O-antigen ligase family protein [Candidatus Aquilonibacter sp.]|nr:O-antigen ligase family protein [Candidatus Aquilonibacter sp.]